MHPACNPQRFTSRYCWIIDKDHIAEEGDEEGTNLNAVGMMGGALADPRHLEGETERFRMLDDDEVLYYEGRIGGDYEGFEPLDDFGMPNAGAVSIQYRNQDDTGWEEI